MSGISDPNERLFKDGLWTYAGAGVWRPQDQLIAYRATLRFDLSLAGVGAGSNYNEVNSPLAGFVYVYTSIIAYNATTAASTVRFSINAALSDFEFLISTYKTPTRYLEFLGMCVAGAGDKLRITWNGCVAGDDVFGYATGYYFKIAE